MCSTSLLKPLYQKNKLPITSNFSLCFLATLRAFCQFSSNLKLSPNSSSLEKSKISCLKRVISNINPVFQIFPHLETFKNYKTSDWLSPYGLTLYHTIPTQRLYGGRLWKTLWEKEKMLVTSIFSFYNSVFCSIEKENKS